MAYVTDIADFLRDTPREEWDEVWWEAVVPYLPLEDVGSMCRMYVEMAEAADAFYARVGCEVSVSALPDEEMMVDSEPQPETIPTVHPLVHPLVQSQGLSPREKIQSILDRPQVAQRTDQWYLEGLKYLTGSQFSQLFASPYIRGQLVLEKAGLSPPPQRSNRLVCTMEETGPFDWGIRFEPVVRAVYMDLTQTFVTDVGRLYHSTLENLAASPDGLVTDTSPESAHRLGRLVEYKAPPTRKLMQKIPKEYYMQMQVQMEVADIDACDYCEMKFYSPYKGKMTEPYPIVQDGRDAQGTVQGTAQGKHYRGWIALIMSDGMLNRYEYSPFEVQDTDWVADLDARLGPTERVYELIPWALEEYYLETVSRDRAWWASIMPAVDGFWTDVEAARAGTWVAPAANPRKKRKVVGAGETAGPQIQDMSDDE